MLYNSLKNRVGFFDSAIAYFRKKLQNTPQGVLKAVLIHGKDRDSYQYYCRENGHDATGKYLRKSDGDLIRKLAQKEYYEKAIKVAEREKTLLCRFLEQSDEDALLKVYTGMNEGKRILVEPYVLPDHEYARRWQAKQYEGGRFEEGDPVYYTKRGDRVRSKSEQIIADRLFDAGVPYRYEYPLPIEGSRPIYTDFTVLNKRTRNMYRWEHFGRMDDPKYRKTFFWKQFMYCQKGYIPGINLIMTFEDNENPLDTRYVDRLIEKFLR